MYLWQTHRLTHRNTCRHTCKYILTDAYRLIHRKNIDTDTHTQTYKRYIFKHINSHIDTISAHTDT